MLRKIFTLAEWLYTTSLGCKVQERIILTKGFQVRHEVILET